MDNGKNEDDNGAFHLVTYKRGPGCVEKSDKLSILKYIKAYDVIQYALLYLDNLKTKVLHLHKNLQTLSLAVLLSGIWIELQEI